MPSFEELEEYKTFLRRGNLTWEGSRMMLPEHKERIRLSNERDFRVEKHELDPDELERIGQVVMDSLHYTKWVKVTYWEQWAYHEAIGIIAQVSKDQKQVKLELENGEVMYITVDCLRWAELV
ncbi:YolD-like family protein [Alkalihalobacillus sp. FSL W8-0930]